MIAKSKMKVNSERSFIRDLNTPHIDRGSLMRENYINIRMFA